MNHEEMEGIKAKLDCEEDMGEGDYYIRMRGYMRL